MTPAIASGSPRIQKHKSCVRCRLAKARCTGLAEDFLRSLDDPNYTPEYPLPRCYRCIEIGKECRFEAPRLKDRPRKTSNKEMPSRSRSPSFHSSPRSICPSLSLRSLDTQLEAPNSPSPPPLSPVPPAATVRALPRLTASPSVASPGPLPPIRKSSALTNPLLRVPPAPSRRLRPPRLSLEGISESYLSEIFVWSPLLPANLAQLKYHLATCDPHLLAAINCMIQPALPPPPFPSSKYRVSLSALQASVFFACRAYGVEDRAQAVAITVWANSHVRNLGWIGDDDSNLASAIDRREVPQFVTCGWTLYSLTILLGVLTGDRSLFGLEVEIKDEINSNTMFSHTLALLRDATEFEHIHSLCPEDQSSYVDWILDRSEQLYRAAVDYLDSTTPAYDPSHHFRPDSLVIASLREKAFISAMLCSTSSILLLSRNMPGPHLLSREFHGDLSIRPTYPPSTRQSIDRAASQALTVARTTRNRHGNLLAFEPHCPCWDVFFLVLAYGLTVSAEGGNEGSRGRRPGGGGTVFSSSSRRQIEEDLNFCDMILAHQEKWSQTETLRKQLATMRETSSDLSPGRRRPSSSSLASLLN